MQIQEQLKYIAIQLNQINICIEQLKNHTETLKTVISQLEDRT